jgi:hypothetical protein
MVRRECERVLRLDLAGPFGCGPANETLVHLPAAGSSSRQKAISRRRKACVTAFTLRCVGQHRPNVVMRQARKIPENFLLAHPPCKVLKNVRRCDTGAHQARFAAADTRSDLNVFLPVHIHHCRRKWRRPTTKLGILGNGSKLFAMGGQIHSFHAAVGRISTHQERR